MENIEKNEQVVVEETEPSPLHIVTPLSKYLAMMLFVILPFLGGWIGYTYAPEKVVEVEKITEAEKVINNVEVEKKYIVSQELSFDTEQNEEVKIRTEKQGKQVTVYLTTDNFQTEKVFLVYEEAREKTDTGNFWGDLEASVALSPDKTMIAYADTEGLKTLSLDGITTNLVYRNSQSDTAEDIRLGLTNFVARPQWSPDSKIIRVKESRYEGSADLFISVSNPFEIIAKNRGGGLGSWHPEKPIFVMPYSNDHGASYSGVEIFDFSTQTVMQNAFFEKEEAVIFSDVTFFPNSDIFTLMSESHYNNLKESIVMDAVTKDYSVMTFKPEN